VTTQLQLINIIIYIYINLVVVTPLCLLLDIFFYYQSEHNILNTIYSFTFTACFGHLQIESERHKHWGGGFPFTVVL